MKRNTNGITLIALIITIIILLILAMVTINILINQGIIGHANNAVRGYEVSEEKELIALAYQHYKMDKVNNSDAQLTVDGANGNQPIDKDDEGVWYIVFDETKNGYELKEDGTVENAEEKWRQIGDTITKGGYTLKVGDYVDYSAVLPDVTLTEDSQVIKDLTEYSGNTDETKNTPDTIQQEKDLKWRVFDVQGGQIRLISETATNSKICLRGYNAYNNIVYLVDEACRDLYGSNVGTSKNLKIEDFVSKLNEEGHQIINDYRYSGRSVGTEVDTDELEITGRVSYSYPNIYPLEIGCKKLNGQDNKGTLGQSEQNQLVNGSSKITGTTTLTMTFWTWSKGSTREDLREKYFKNPVYAKLFTVSESCYFSSRSVAPQWLNLDWRWFMLVKKDSWTPHGSIGMDQTTSGSNASLRPTITLNSDVVITKDADHDGTSSKPCTIQ